MGLAAIIGCTVSGLVVLLGASAGAMAWRRRQRKHIADPTPLHGSYAELEERAATARHEDDRASG